MNDKTEMTQEAARPKRKFGPSTVARLQVARVSEMRLPRRPDGEYLG